VPAETLFTIFTHPLETAPIEYMVSGSVAAMVYGEPRFTNDVDVVIYIGHRDAAQIVQAFPERRFYCPPAEVIAIESRRPRRGHFNVIHHETGYQADMYTSADDPLHAWARPRRRRIEIGNGREISVAPGPFPIRGHARNA